MASGFHNKHLKTIQGYWFKAIPLFWRCRWSLSGEWHWCVPRARACPSEASAGEGSHMLLGAKQIALPGLKNSAEKTGEDCRIQISAVTGRQRQVRRWTEEPQPSSPLHCLHLTYSGHPSPNATVVRLGAVRSRLCVLKGDGVGFIVTTPYCYELR